LVDQIIVVHGGILIMRFTGESDIDIRQFVHTLVKHTLVSRTVPKTFLVFNRCRCSSILIDIHFYGQSMPYGEQALTWLILIPNLLRSSVSLLFYSRTGTASPSKYGLSLTVESLRESSAEKSSLP